MKTSKILVVTAIALTLSMNNFAISKPVTKSLPKSSVGLNVAVVDVQKIIESSPAINKLKTDRKNKIDDLASFVEKARADVAKEDNAAKKKTLEDNYNNELNTRKNNIDKEYAKKLSDIDKDITNIIQSKAKKSNFNLVLTKTSVLDGGTDITSVIVKELK